MLLYEQNHFEIGQILVGFVQFQNACPAPVPPSARGHRPAPQQHTHLDCVSWSAWPDCDRARTLAHLGRLVAAHDVGPRRVGYRSSRRPLPDLLRRSHGPLVCRRSLRLSATYIELHASSAFSFLEGASLPEELIAACAEYSMPAIALLDRDGVYGAPRLHLAGKKAGLQAHIGAEVTCTTGVRYPLLAETREGYQNLCRLMTRMKLRAAKGKGAITEDELAAYARGLICLTGGDCGPLTTAIPNGNGAAMLERLVAIFGSGNVYVELQRHYDRAEEAINQRAVALAETFHLPLLATNGVRYASRHQREILDVFTC